MANGISPCAGGAAAAVFAVPRPRCPVPTSDQVSTVVHPHGLTNRFQRIARGIARPLAPLGDDTRTSSGFSSNSWARLDIAETSATILLDQRRLAVQTAGCRGRAASLLHPVSSLRARIDLVQIPDRALVRIAGIGAPARARDRSASPSTSWRRNPGPRAIRWYCRRTSTSCGRRDPGLSRRGEQHLGLGQDGDARAFEVAEQAVAIRHGQTRVSPRPAPRARASASPSPFS